jgi:hypothetical protein
VLIRPYCFSLARGHKFMFTPAGDTWVTLGAAD